MLNNKKYIFFFLILVFFIQFVSALGIRERENEPEPVVIQVIGVVRLIGSGSLPEIVISGQEFEWFVVREERNKLLHLQHRTVTVEGEETVREITFVSGMSAGFRRELRNIKIITIH